MNVWISGLSLGGDLTPFQRALEKAQVFTLEDLRLLTEQDLCQVFGTDCNIVLRRKFIDEINKLSPQQIALLVEQKTPEGIATRLATLRNHLDKSEEYRMRTAIRAMQIKQELLDRCADIIRKVQDAQKDLVQELETTVFLETEQREKEKKQYEKSMSDLEEMQRDYPFLLSGKNRDSLQAWSQKVESIQIDDPSLPLDFELDARNLSCRARLVTKRGDSEVTPK